MKCIRIIDTAHRMNSIGQHRKTEEMTTVYLS